MPRVSPIRKTRIGVKALRVLTRTGKGHRPSAFNSCIAAALKGKSYPKPEPGKGGMRNVEVHKAFIEAAKKCGARIKESTIRKWEKMGIRI